MTVEYLQKKALVVATMRWDGSDERAAEIKAFVADVDVPGGDTGGSAFLVPEEQFGSQPDARVWNSQEHCWIPVPVGHRVVKGALGELYPLSPDAEAATFDPAADENTMVGGMRRAELIDALDGLHAYDGGAVSSGIRDEVLRGRCIAALDAMTDRQRAELVRDMWLTGQRLDQGYAYADLAGFVRWLNECMEQA